MPNGVRVNRDANGKVVPYPPEVKEAFRRLLLDGVRARKAAKQTGIPRNTGYEWERALRSDPEYIATLTAKADAALEKHRQRIVKYAKAMDTAVDKAVEYINLGDEDADRYMRIIVSAYAAATAANTTTADAATEAPKAPVTIEIVYPPGVEKPTESTE